MPSLTQVITIASEDGGLRAIARPSTATTPVAGELAALTPSARDQRAALPLAEGDHGAKKSRLTAKSAADACIEADRVGYDNAPRACSDFRLSSRQGGRPRSSRTRTPTNVEKIFRLAGRRKLLSCMGFWSTRCTTTARSTITRSAPCPEGARLASELGTECHAIVIGLRPLRLLLSSATGSPRRSTASGSRGPSQPWSTRGRGDRWRADPVRAVRAAACSAFRDRRRLADAPYAGVCNGVTNVLVEDGQFSSPSGRSCRTRQISSVHYRAKLGVIIGVA